LITTDLPICAKSADNGALMNVLLKEAEYCSTETTGKAGTETAASLASTIPNTRVSGKRTHREP
jgi:hypothetical protein